METHGGESAGETAIVTAMRLICQTQEHQLQGYAYQYFTFLHFKYILMLSKRSEQFFPHSKVQLCLKDCTVFQR